TRNGGVTLYTPASPGGVPASVVGAAPELRASALSMNQLAGYLLGQSLIASNAVGHLVEIDVRMVSPEAYAALPEVVPSAVPAVAFRSGVLRITIQPDQGAAGRPSSARIVRVLAGA